MKKITQTKALALAASMLLTVSAAEAKLVKPSTYTPNVVVSKVFYAGAKDANNKNYMNSKYVELFNISSDTLNLEGMYIALVEAESNANAWTAQLLAEQHPDSIALKQVFRLPAGAKLDPYASLLIANSAIDHSPNGENFPNLSGADYEAKDAQGKVTNNEAVPALEVAYSAYPTISYMNLVQGGPCGVVLLTEDTKVSELPLVYSPGKTKGNQFMLAPKSKVIDGVEIVKMTEEDIVRLNATGVDTGYVAITSKTGYTGEVVYRKTAYVVGGTKTVLYDTNNSSLDFAVSTTLQPREYDATPAGLTAQDITIPASGFLAVNIDKPFFGPKDMVLCYVNASNNAQTTDLRYNEFRGDSTLLMKGDWIAIAKPGTYQLQLSASQGVMRSRSSSQAWSTDDSKTLTGSQASRRIYKFSNAEGKVGFQRVPATAEGKYNVADFSDGNRLYIMLTDAIGARIYEACGAASWDALDFIPWHGATPDDAATAITQIVNSKSVNSKYYDLQGRLVVKPSKGIYVKDGKKIIIK